MKKKYIIGSVAALATLTICGYAIMQHQSEQTESKNKVAYVEKKANSKQNSKARKAENLTRLVPKKVLQQSRLSLKSLQRAMLLLTVITIITITGKSHLMRFLVKN